MLNGFRKSLLKPEIAGDLYSGQPAIIIIIHIEKVKTKNALN